MSANGPIEQRPRAAFGEIQVAAIGGGLQRDQWL